MRFERRLAQLEKRRTSHTYIPGTVLFDEAIRAFFFRVKARACEGCLQAEEAEADEAVFCFPECPTFLACEADEAALLNQDDMLERILYERIMTEKR